MKQKKCYLKLAENVLEVAITANLIYATNISDPPYVNNTSDLADRCTNIVLNIISEDTLIFIFILDILQNKKVRKII